MVRMYLSCLYNVLIIFHIVQIIDNTQTCNTDSLLNTNISSNGIIICLYNQPPFQYKRNCSVHAQHTIYPATNSRGGGTRPPRFAPLIILGNSEMLSDECNAFGNATPLECCLFQVPFPLSPNILDPSIGVPGVHSRAGQP